MPKLIDNSFLEDAITRAAMLSLSFLESNGATRPVPFTLTPAPLARKAYDLMSVAAPLLGRLTQAIANDSQLIQEVHAPIVTADPFFAELLDAHAQLHGPGADAPRLPLLLQRADFMVDITHGPRIVECNSIAAGMAPFGEQVSNLHRYLLDRHPQHYQAVRESEQGEPLANPVTQRMAQAIAATAREIASDLEDDGPLRFLMVVQENEDNVFDQVLLENALHLAGIETHRRTLRQLHAELSTGPRESLHLANAGTLHVVYLRTGYQWHDYLALDLDRQRCCDALQQTRVFLERHRVALNATIAQQLATSKRMQLFLSQSLAHDGNEHLQNLGFSKDEQAVLRSVFTDMRSINAHTHASLRDHNDSENWVLKNQGEGGGHCLFGDDILQRLGSMQEQDYNAWTLMRRLYPKGSNDPTLVVRSGSTEEVHGLVSEIGLFTAHMDEKLLAGAKDSDSLGYLVRSKPPLTNEGGIHSGFGALDSLYITDA